MIVDCTVARNACEVTLGEGATAQSAVIGYPSGKFGGIVNCTFVDNRMLTADVVDRGFATRAVPLVNDIFWSTDADYAPYGATTPGNKGFDMRNTIACNTEYEKDPQFAPKPAIDAQGMLAYPVRKPGAAAGKGLNVTVGDNLLFAIGDDSAWSGGAPTAPVTMTTDIFGAVREPGKFNLGSTQQTVPTGFAILLR